MDIEKLKDRLLEWDGVDAVDNGEFTEANYHGVFELLREAADALEQLQAENDRLRRERDAAVEEMPKVCYYCKHREGWKTCDRFNGNSEAETCTNWQWRGPKEE